MINEWVPRLAFNWPEWIKKPLFACPICMAWWHGLLILFIGYKADIFPPYGIVAQFLIISAAGGINAVLIYIISANKEEVKALKDDE